MKWLEKGAAPFSRLESLKTCRRFGLHRQNTHTSTVATYSVQTFISIPPHMSCPVFFFFNKSALNCGLCLPHNHICSYLLCLHCSFPNFRLHSSWFLTPDFFHVGGATATCLGGDSPTKSSLMLLWDLNFKSQDYSPILKVLHVYHCLQGNRKKICKVKNPQ